MAVFSALNLILGAGLCLLDSGLLFAGEWKDKLIGLVIVAADAGLAVGRAMMFV